MIGDVSTLSLRSVLLSVRDLDRSVAFYEDVTQLREVLREDRIAVLEGDVTGSSTLYVREAHRNATMSGQQALGVRALGWTVGSFAELDRVEARLRALDSFRDRRAVAADCKIEQLRGHDPDRLPLTFVAYESGTTMTVEIYHRALATMYAVDL